MNTILRTAALLISTATALSACGSSDNDPGPGGVSVGEAKALDEAAEMIEARRLPQEAAVGEDDRTAPDGDTIVNE